MFDQLFQPATTRLIFQKPGTLVRVDPSKTIGHVRRKGRELVALLQEIGYRVEGLIALLQTLIQEVTELVDSRVDLMTLRETLNIIDLLLQDTLSRLSSNCLYLVIPAGFTITAVSTLYTYPPLDHLSCEPGVQNALCFCEPQKEDSLSQVEKSSTQTMMKRTQTTYSTPIIVSGTMCRPLLTLTLYLLSLCVQTLCFVVSLNSHLHQANPRLHQAVFILYVSTSPALTHPLHHITRAGPSETQETGALWTIPLRGWPNTGYCAMMQFGVNHQQTFCMIVDTGSSNTAVAATREPALGTQFFNMNRTGEDFVNVGTSVSVTYTSGEWSGYLVADKVGFGDFGMDESNFALITSSTDFFIAGADWAGILGLGYRSLAKPNSAVGTVWDSVREANGLRDVFSMQLCPPKESTKFPGTFIQQGGYMTMGGINSSLYHTNRQIHYTKIVEETFFNVLLTDISVGDKRIDLSCKEFNTDKTIVDSGTTDLYFPHKVFLEIKQCFIDYFKDGLPMAVPEEFWEGERKLLWQAAHIEEIYECFPTIHLSMADHSNSREEFNLAIVPQLYLRQIDVEVGEADPAMCPPTSPCDAFTFGVKPRAQGTVIGANAMLGYYTVFDRENKRVGFVESTCEYRSSESAPYISGPYSREPEDCKMPVLTTPWATITYCCGAITMSLATTMTAIVVTVQVKRSHRKRVNKRNLTLKNSDKITEPAPKSRVPLLCCIKPIDEGYVSEAPPSPTFVMSSTTTAIQPDDTQGSDELIVGNAAPQQLAAVEWNGTVRVLTEPEETNTREVCGARKSKRKRRRRRRRKHEPVMESGVEEGGHDIMCVETASRPRPLAATDRSHGNSVLVSEHGVYYETQMFNSSTSHHETAIFVKLYN